MMSNEMKYVLYAAIVAVSAGVGYWAGGKFIPDTITSQSGLLGAAGGVVLGAAASWAIHSYM